MSFSSSGNWRSCSSSSKSEEQKVTHFNGLRSTKVSAPAYIKQPEQVLYVNALQQKLTNKHSLAAYVSD